MLAPADARPSAAELLLKSCFRPADDTVERRRLEVLAAPASPLTPLHPSPWTPPPPPTPHEVAAFFSNPPSRSAGDLRLMREIQELTAALPKGRREVCPAARLSDVAELLEGELMPRLVSFSGHEFNGSSRASRPRNGR